MPEGRRKTRGWEGEVEKEHGSWQKSVIVLFVSVGYIRPDKTKFRAVRQTDNRTKIVKRYIFINSMYRQAFGLCHIQYKFLKYGNILSLLCVN